MTTLPLTLYNCDYPLEYIQQSIAQHGLPTEIFEAMLGLYDTPHSKFSQSLYPNILSSLSQEPLGSSCALAQILFAPLIYQNDPNWDILKPERWDILCEIFNHNVPFRTVEFDGRNTQMDLQFKMFLTVLSTPLNDSFKQQIKKDVLDTWNETRFQNLLSTLKNWLQEHKNVSFEPTTFSVLINNLYDIGVSNAFVCPLAQLVSDKPDLLDIIVKKFQAQMKPYIQEHWKTLIMPHVLQNVAARKVQVWDVLSFVARFTPNTKFDPFTEYKILERCVHRLQEIEYDQMNEFSSSMSCARMMDVYTQLSQATVLDFFVKKVDESKNHSSLYMNKLTLCVERLCALDLNVDAVLLNEKRFIWDHETPYALSRVQSLALTTAVAPTLKKRTSKRKKI